MQGMKLRQVFKRVCEKLKHLSQDDVRVILWNLQLSHLFYTDAPDCQIAVLQRKRSHMIQRVGEYRYTMIVDISDGVFEDYFP